MSLPNELIAKLGLDQSPFERGLRSAKAKLADFASSGARLLGGLAVGAGLTSTARSILRFADNLKTSADALTTNVEFLQGFHHAANQAGVGAEAASRGLEHFVRKLGEAIERSPEAIRMFERLGIKILDLQGAPKTLEVIFRDVADKIASIEDPAVRVQTAFELFGRGGLRMIPILKDGAAAFDQMANSIDKLSSDEVAKLDKIDKKFDEFVTRLKVKLGKEGVVFLDFLADPSTAFNPKFIDPLKKAVKEPSSLFKEPVKSAVQDPSTLFEPWVNDAARWITTRFKALLSPEFRNFFGMDEVIDTKLSEIPSRRKLLGATGSPGENPGILEDVEAFSKAMADAQKAEADLALQRLSAEEQLVELLKKKRDLEVETAQQGPLSVEGAKRMTVALKELAKVEKEIESTSRTIETAKQNTLLLQGAIIKAQGKLAEAEMFLTKTKEDRAKFGLQELATSPIRYTGQLGNDQRSAREVMALEAQAERLRVRGHGPRAAQLYDRADEIRKSMVNLHSGERNPWEVMQRDIEAQREAVVELNRKASQEGLKIIPQNGR
jgi:hypothetical protein